MVISVTLLTTIISTIIAVTMASILFCCWPKKKSAAAEITDSKTKSIKNDDATKDKPISTTPTVVKRENGVTTEIQSDASKCEMTLPLLSSPALEEDTKDELGDFSSVQRETEILRSYRKPPPPKRAKQRRVPRNVNTGSKSLDIFTELYDEDSNQGSDKENNDSNDDVDSCLLRQDREKTARDTRSSMLADIELTLAALHMTEQSTAPLSRDSLSEDKIRITGLTAKDVNKSNADENIIAKKKSEYDMRNSIESEDKQSFSSSLLRDLKTEPVPAVRKESPKVSPIAAVRRAPKVSPKPSPKPSPKVRSKLSYHDDTNTIKTVLDKSSDILTSASPTPSLELNGNNTENKTTILEIIASPSTQPLGPATDIKLTDEKLPDPTTTTISGVSDSEINTNEDISQIQARSEPATIASQANLVSTADEKHEDNTNKSIASNSSETTTSSDREQNIIENINTISDEQKEERREDSGKSNIEYINTISSEQKEERQEDRKENSTEYLDTISSEQTEDRKEDRETPENDVTDKALEADTNKETSTSNNVEIGESDSYSDNQPQPECQTVVTNSKEMVVDSLNKQAIQDETDKLTSTDIKDQPVEEVARQSSLDSETSSLQHGLEQVARRASPDGETSSLQHGLEEVARRASPDGETSSLQHDITSRGRSQESGKQRNAESTEDQAGKGKISKIPVRAGSKPRSSSPKLLSSETAPSPTT